jgi:hypothetical protein
MSGNTGCETNLASAGKKVCGTMCVGASSCCGSGDCTTPPAPTACYASSGTCSGVGGSCSYSLKNGSRVCGAVCCNAVNGTCNVNCTLTCTGGYADCDGDPSNGCEVNLASAGKKLCGSACIVNTSCCNNADCTTPQAPTTCYQAQGTCSGPGGTCSYTLNSGAKVCSGNVCCNPNNSTCDASCTPQCASGFLNCNSSPTDGCETACNLPNANPGCAGSACGIASCKSGFQNCDNNVANGCECGTSCCTNPMTSAPACLVNNHTDGWGDSFAACYPLGSPGDPTTYFAIMANDAAMAHTAFTGTIQAGLTCSTGAEQVTSTCKYNKTLNQGSCTCWSYAGTAGMCKDPADGLNKPCTSYVGHTYFSTNGCKCQSTSDPTWQ